MTGRRGERHEPPWRIPSTTVVTELSRTAGARRRGRAGSSRTGASPSGLNGYLGSGHNPGPGGKPMAPDDTRRTDITARRRARRSATCAPMTPDPARRPSRPAPRRPGPDRRRRGHRPGGLLRVHAPAVALASARTEVRTADGEKMGKVKDVYLDADARHARYLVVKTGWFSGTHVVPVDDVTYIDRTVTRTSPCRTAPSTSRTRRPSATTTSSRRSASARSTTTTAAPGTGTRRATSSARARPTRRRPRRSPRPRWPTRSAAATTRPGPRQALGGLSADRRYGRRRRRALRHFRRCAAPASSGSPR